MKLRRTPTPPLFQSITQEMDQLQANIRRMFDDPTLGMDAFGFARPIGWLPPVEITESDGSIMVTAELPGLDAKDVTVSLDGDMLTIRGEKKQEERTEDKQYHLVERSYGAFQRSFTLPPAVERDKIAAEFTKGVLTLTLPKGKASAPRGREIPVTAT